MDFRTRVGLAFVLLGCILGIMVALDTLYGTAVPQDNSALPQGTLVDQVFTKAGFLYGPQSWRPGYNPLGIEPGKAFEDNGTWYLMFIDMNATPVSGDPNVRRIGSVRVTYNLTGLNGRAAFHTYGLTRGSLPTRTNRQEGYNSCGFVVLGSAADGSPMPAASPLALSGTHRYAVAIANNQLADSDTLAATTRTLAFYPPAGSGEGALHITRDLATRMGTVTETAEQNGSFFITATGTEPGNDLLLLVAVDRPQTDVFSLRIRTEFVRGR